MNTQFDTETLKAIIQEGRRQGFTDTFIADKLNIAVEEMAEHLEGKSTAQAIRGTKIISRRKNIEAMLATIGTDGIDDLIAEECRRGLTTRQIADKFHIPLNNAKFFALGHANTQLLKAGDRIRLLNPLMSYKYCNGTVIEQIDNFVTFRKDGYPPPTPDMYDYARASALRHEVELTDTPELLPDEATFDQYGYLAIPCELSPKGTQLRFYCPHCKRWHSHGLGDGYRCSHCTKRDSPLSAREVYYVFLKEQH